MRHAVEQHQSRPRDRRGDGSSPGGPHQDVVAPMDHHRRGGDLQVIAAQATAAHRRVKMPRDALRVIGAVVTLRGVHAQPLLGSPIARASDDAGHPHRVLDDLILGGIRRRTLDQTQQRLGRRWRQERGVVRRENDAQPASALREACRENLRDHPAHRRPDDVGAFDTQVIEDRNGILSHIVEMVDTWATQAEEAAQQFGHQ